MVHEQMNPSSAFNQVHERACKYNRNNTCESFFKIQNLLIFSRMHVSIENAKTNRIFTKRKK